MGRDGCHTSRTAILLSSIGTEQIMAIATINPATGQTIKQFDALTDSQVDQKIQRATEAFLRRRLQRSGPEDSRARCRKAA